MLCQGQADRTRSVVHNCHVLLTAAHNNRYQLEMTADAVARAESELFDFEASLEDTLSRELESMEKEEGR